MRRSFKMLSSFAFSAGKEEIFLGKHITPKKKKKITQTLSKLLIKVRQMIITDLSCPVRKSSTFACDVIMLFEGKDKVRKRGHWSTTQVVPTFHRWPRILCRRHRFGFLIRGFFLLGLHLGFIGRRRLGTRSKEFLAQIW